MVEHLQKFISNARVALFYVKLRKERKKGENKSQKKWTVRRKN